MRPVKNINIFRRRSVRFALILVVLLLSLMIYMAIVAIDRPPVVKDMTAMNLTRIDHGNGSFSYGKNWLRKSESGLWEAYIEGKPFERGLAFGQLTKELLYYQESSFFDQINELVPSKNYLKVLKYFIAFFNRNLDRCIPEEYKQEIYGTSFACDSSFNFIGSGYQRQLNYHAAHDIGHALQGLNLTGCTSFSVWNDRSVDSSLLIGRNFDFYMGEKFAENKIVCFVKPDRGYGFMMVTWADLIGVVSGMNEKGLTVTLNAAKSSVPLQAATPVTLLAREILQYASTIKEAYNIALKRDLFVSESIMIGSSIDNETAVIEKSPRKTFLFDPAGNQIICSNHFQGEGFATDPKNIKNIRESDSFDRYRRVEELLERKTRLDETDIAGILRDRLVIGDMDAGMGNQLAINQLLAHHSVIFNADSLIAWVSTSPWQLGKYVAYDLKKILSLNAYPERDEIYSAQRNIPADSFLISASFTRFGEFKELSEVLNEYKDEGKVLPGGFIEDYTGTNPQFYKTYVNLGEYFIKMKDYTSAYNYYNKALECKMPGLADEQNLTTICRKLSKKINNGSAGN